MNNKNIKISITLFIVSLLAVLIAYGLSFHKLTVEIVGSFNAIVYKQEPTGEKVYFSYEENGQCVRLPEGCPPPVIELPEEKNPCANGYEIGQVISSTIANIVTPILNSDDHAINPVTETE